MDENAAVPEKWLTDAMRAAMYRSISSQLRHVLTIGKNLLSSNISPACPTIWWTSAH